MCSSPRFEHPRGRRNVLPLCLLAAVVVLAGTAFVPHGLAQAPAPDQMRPGELDAARAATQAVLAAWQAGETERLRERSLEEFHPSLAGTRGLLWQHMTVHEVGEPRPTVRLSRRDLEFEFSWEAQLDTEGFVEAAMQRLRRQAREQGVGAQFDETAEARQAQLTRWAAGQADRIGFSPQRVVMRNTDRGWRLAEWLTVRMGASEADVAVALFLAAFSSRDLTQTRGALAPEFRGAFSDRIGRHLLLGSVLRHHEQATLERPAGDPNVAHVLVHWQVDFRPEWVERHLLEEYRWELEFDHPDHTPEQREVLLNEFRNEVERRTTAYATLVETFAARLTVERHFGRWYVAEVQPLEADVDGGAPNPEEAVRAGLQALRSHDFQAIERLYDPVRPDGFARDAEGRRVARALTVESYELGETLRRETMPRRARLEFTWEATLDVEALKESMREEYREHMRGRGHNDETIEELLRDREAALAEYVEQLRQDLERENQAAELRRIGDSWYLIDLVAG